MEKKQSTAKQKMTSLGLQTETLHRLEASQLQGVAGGSRVRIPLGYAANTTPIYDDGNG